jgi:protein-tyrosine phosphatase
MVCTGNICRSPAMHYLAAREWGAAAEVTSAGTFAEIGMDVPAPMRRAANSSGLTIPRHRPTQLTSALIDRADLVLVATQTHLRWIEDEMGYSPTHVFGLKQSAELASRAPTLPQRSAAERLSAAAEVLLAANEAAPVPVRSLDDPWARDQVTYDRVYGEIAAALEELTTWAGVDRP